MLYYRHKEKRRFKEMKQFIYQVEGFEYTDTEAFGKAWKEAKEEATRLHAPISRIVIDGYKVREEIYYKGHIFNSVKFATPDNIYIF